MHPRLFQILAALAATVSFGFAFGATAMPLVSSLFMLAGLACVGWLAFSLVSRTRRRTP